MFPNCLQSKTKQNKPLELSAASNLPRIESPCISSVNFLEFAFNDEACRAEALILQAARLERHDI
jgi:hypothetical protein